MITPKKDPKNMTKKELAEFEAVEENQRKEDFAEYMEEKLKLMQRLNVYEMAFIALNPETGALEPKFRLKRHVWEKPKEVLIDENGKPIKPQDNVGVANKTGSVPTTPNSKTPVSKKNKAKKDLKK